MITLNLNRRDFIKYSSITGILPHLNDKITLNNKSVIFLFLSGGISSVESYAPSDSVPEEYRSLVGSLNTNIASYKIGGSFIKQSTICDKMSIFKNFAHTNSGHSGASHWVITGKNHREADNGAVPIWPSLGSVTSRYFGTTNDNGLPYYVKTNGHYSDGPSWLGGQFEPFDSSGDGRRNMELNLSKTRLDNRIQLLKEFDKLDKLNNDTITINEFNKQAYSLLINDAKNAFNIEQEPQHIKDLYGNTKTGKNLLLARRLCQSGSKFVFVSDGNWDFHSGLRNLWDKQAPSLDQAIYGLITDLYQSGLHKDILLIITSEFARTPKINNLIGRDHFPYVITLVMSGGNLNHGQVIGECSDKADKIIGHQYEPKHLICSIFKYLDINTNLQYTDNFGRPQNLCESSDYINEIF